jgi:hypothetical protein
MNGRLALLVLSGAFVTAGASLSAADMMTLTGTVTDAMCGMKHPSGAAAADCTKECVKKGSDYALVSNGKVYTLKADAAQKAELDKLAGKEAEVMGDANGMTLMVKSVKVGMMKK